MIILNRNITSYLLRDLIFISDSKVASTIDTTVLHHVTAERTETKIVLLCEKETNTVENKAKVKVVFCSVGLFGFRDNNSKNHNMLS